MGTRHKIAISTISMGWHASHTLDDKLEAIAKYGYDGTELFWTDLDKDASTRNITVQENAQRVRSKCDELGIGICSLSSFDNFDGSQTVPLATRLGKAHEWIKIARILGSDIIQIPANDDVSSLAASADQCVEELRMLADAGSSTSGDEKTITWAYEPMAWSARDDTWQAALHTVRRVARPNFKLCLDTYHILAKLWADCTSADGCKPGGRLALEASMHDLPRTIRPEEIGFVQLSDAEKMDPPVSIRELNEIGKHYSHYWCTWGRLFPFEEEHRAYLPVNEVCGALLKEVGWTGWVSQEIFHRSMKEERPSPDEWARRGMESWEKVKKAVEI